MKKTHHKKKPSILKKWVSKLHLWFGLIIGGIIFIVSITGALFVFKDEIENFSRHDVIYHQEQNIENKTQLPIREMEKLVAAQTNEKYPIHWVNIPIDKKMSYMFYWYEHNENAWNYFDEFPIYKQDYSTRFLLYKRRYISSSQAVVPPTLIFHILPPKLQLSREQKQH